MIQLPSKHRTGYHCPQGAKHQSPVLIPKRAGEAAPFPDLLRAPPLMQSDCLLPLSVVRLWSYMPSEGKERLHPYL